MRKVCSLIRQGVYHTHTMYLTICTSGIQRLINGALVLEDQLISDTNKRHIKRQISGEQDQTHGHEDKFPLGPGKHTGVHIMGNDKPF